MEKIPVVILAGGLGMRLREETEFRPKPMVQIGNRPILWHIMKIYAHHGLNSFIICLGYKGDIIKQYFLQYQLIHSDFTIGVGRKRKITVHKTLPEEGWSVTLADTGPGAMTGARISRIQPYLKHRTFMMTYGDGVADIDLVRLLRFHRSHGKIATVTGINPPSRFGEISIRGHQAVEFSEKPQTKNGNCLVNGGFFIFNDGIFRYLSSDDSCTLEKEVLKELACDGELMVYKHEGFWHCMDTLRDVNHLNDLWQSGNAQWKIWK